MERKEFIICSAIHYKDGIKRIHQPKNIDTGIVVCGRRHHNIIMTLYSLLGDKYDPKLVSFDCQGFLTNLDRWVSREEAKIIATEAGQLSWKVPDKNGYVGDELFSEDLY